MAPCGVRTPVSLRRTAGPAAEPARLAAAVHDTGRAAGLVAVGIAGVPAFEETRTALERRRHEGLAAGMQFTYRNPARSTQPARILAGARALVVGAMAFPGPGDDGPSRPGEGRVGRYARADHYGPLREALGAVAAELEAGGWRARIVCDDNALVDRAAAWRAGIGWYGRNAMVIVPGHGSWVLLGSVVTDAPLPVPAAAPASHAVGCGRCTRCLDACPTGALVGPGVLDARRCLAWLLQAPGAIPEEWRVAVGDRIYGCDDCQTSCPHNRTADRRGPAGRPLGRAAGERIDLLDLLGTGDDDLLARFGRWYVAGRDPRHLRRNALVALANTARPDDGEALAALAAAAAGADPLLAEHGRWGLARLAARAARGGVA